MNGSAFIPVLTFRCELRPSSWRQFAQGPVGNSTLPLGDSDSVPSGCTRSGFVQGIDSETRADIGVLATDHGGWGVNDQGGAFSRKVSFLISLAPIRHRVVR
jgi:hypothetical protein